MAAMESGAASVHGCEFGDESAKVRACQGLAPDQVTARFEGMVSCRARSPMLTARSGDGSSRE